MNGSMFLSIFPAPNEWNSKLVALVTSSLPEKYRELVGFPALVTTGPNCGVSSRKVPSLTPKALAILVNGVSEGMISPASIASRTSFFTLLFSASSSMLIFCLSLILLIFEANCSFFSIISLFYKFNTKSFSIL